MNVRPLAQLCLASAMLFPACGVQVDQAHNTRASVARALAVAPGELSMVSGPRWPEGLWVPKDWSYLVVTDDGSVGSIEQFCYRAEAYAKSSFHQMFFDLGEELMPVVDSAKECMGENPKASSGAIIWFSPEAEMKSIHVALALMRTVGEQPFAILAEGGSNQFCRLPTHYFQSHWSPYPEQWPSVYLKLTKVVPGDDSNGWDSEASQFTLTIGKDSWQGLALSRVLAGLQEMESPEQPIHFHLADEAPGKILMEVAAALKAKGFKYLVLDF